MPEYRFPVDAVQMPPEIPADEPGRDGLKVVNQLAQLNRRVRLKKQVDLNISGMVKNHHLAKSISDAGWGQIIMIVIFKAEEAGRTVIKMNPSYTSQDCSRCGRRNRITLATRIYQCSKCGLVIHRDRNGAKRIEQKGRAGP